MFAAPNPSTPLISAPDFDGNPKDLFGLRRHLRIDGAHYRPVRLQLAQLIFQDTLGCCVNSPRNIHPDPFFQAFSWFRKEDVEPSGTATGLENVVQSSRPLFTIDEGRRGRSAAYPYGCTTFLDRGCRSWKTGHARRVLSLHFKNQTGSNSM